MPPVWTPLPDPLSCRFGDQHEPPPLVPALLLAAAPPAQVNVASRIEHAITQFRYQWLCYR